MQNECRLPTVADTVCVWLCRWTRDILSLGGHLLYNGMLVFAIQEHESATIIRISPLSRASLPTRHPIPLGHHRAPSWAPCLSPDFFPCGGDTEDTSNIEHRMCERYSGIICNVTNAKLFTAFHFITTKISVEGESKDDTVFVYCCKWHVIKRRCMPREQRCLVIKRAS